MFKFNIILKVKYRSLMKASVNIKLCFMRKVANLYGIVIKIKINNNNIKIKNNKYESCHILKAPNINGS